MLYLQATAMQQPAAASLHDVSKPATPLHPPPPLLHVVQQPHKVLTAKKKMKLAPAGLLHGVS
jgi:hypothetical protein